VRLRFIRKVYLILACQLLLTAAFVALSTFNMAYVSFIRQNMWLFWVCLVVNIVLLYVLVYVRAASRRVPLNFGLLGLFTLTEAYMVSCITSVYDPLTVFIAAVLTASIVVALTIYACTTKTDFTVCGGLLFTALMALIVASIFSMFFQNKIVQIIISAVSVVVFSVYLIYDTQLIIGNGELKLTVDDYIFAAMNLYLDIIRIFLEILRIVGQARN
jgi:FtsH-binding integral membrane protein